MGKFSGSKTPKVKDPVDPQAAVRKAEEVAADERRRLAAGGRASTILTGALGDQTEASVARNVLLGGM
mgnify:CR=1 FL=1